MVYAANSHPPTPRPPHPTAIWNQSTWTTCWIYMVHIFLKISGNIYNPEQPVGVLNMRLHCARYCTKRVCLSHVSQVTKVVWIHWILSPRWMSLNKLYTSKTHHDYWTFTDVLSYAEGPILLQIMKEPIISHLHSSQTQHVCAELRVSSRMSIDVVQKTCLNCNLVAHHKKLFRFIAEPKQILPIHSFWQKNIKLNILSCKTM